MSSDDLPASFSFHKGIGKARLEIKAVLNFRDDASRYHRRLAVYANFYIFVSEGCVDRGRWGLNKFFLFGFSSKSPALICSGEIIGNNSLKGLLVST